MARKRKQCHVDVSFDGPRGEGNLEQGVGQPEPQTEDSRNDVCEVRHPRLILWCVPDTDPPWCLEALMCPICATRRVCVMVCVSRR